MLKERGQRQRELWDRADQAIQPLIHAADVLFRASLVGAGYHQYQRGEWRRKRGWKKEGAMSDERGLERLSLEERNRVQDILERASKGDRSVVTELSTLLDRYPEIWNRV